MPPVTASEVGFQGRPSGPILYPTDGPHEFLALGDSRYQLTWTDPGIQLEVDRVRRVRDELIGELTVRCDLDGAKRVGNAVSVGDFNFSAIGARKTLATHLADRAATSPKDVDWYGLLEMFVQQVHGAERAGQPSQSLRDFARPEMEGAIDIDGFRVLPKHPQIVFGDGGTLKSMHGLYIATKLTTRGLRVGYFDWEMDGPAHRARLERLCGSDMPDITYVRCERPLVHEVDRLRRIVRDSRLDFAIFDSIGFACNGAPEAAESAIGYAQAVRQLGPIGSYHIAHVVKNDGGDQKPFGSVFWYNFARIVYYVKLAPSPGSPSIATLGFYNRKHNLGPVCPIGLRFAFEHDRTYVEPVDIGEIADLAVSLPIASRMKILLKHGAMTIAAIASAIDQKPDSVEKAAKRRPELFAPVLGADGIRRIGLAAGDRRSEADGRPTNEYSNYQAALAQDTVVTIRNGGTPKLSAEERVALRATRSNQVITNDGD
jgi:hypothetical protein